MKTATVISALSLLGCTDLATTYGEREQSLERGRTQITMVSLGRGTASSVNTAGDVAVSSSDGVTPRALRWRDGVLTELARTGDAYGAYATVINERGDVGGFLAYRTGTALGEETATLWIDPTNPLIVDTNRTMASKVQRLNSAGQVGVMRADVHTVGLADMDDFFWSGVTGPVAIGDLGGGARGIQDMNEAGTVVGVSLMADGTSHAFRWTPGEVMTDLGAIGPLSWARAINERDEVAGSTAEGPCCGNVPVKWSGGLIQQLDTRHGDAHDINNSGHVVGERQIDGHRYATLWRDGVAIDLGAGPGSVAYRISDMDVVVGNSPNGPFVWTNPAEGAVWLPMPAGARSQNFYEPALAGNFVAGFVLTDAGGEAMRWEIDVTPLSEEGPIADLQVTIQSLEESGGVNHGEARSLDAKLAGARMQCERGNEQAARGQLEAFINHVSALVSAGRISTTDGEALIAEARAILADLTCPA